MRRSNKFNLEWVLRGLKVKDVILVCRRSHMCLFFGYGGGIIWYIWWDQQILAATMCNLLHWGLLRTSHSCTMGFGCQVPPFASYPAAHFEIGILP